jgi:hypothetical protein
VNLRDIDWRFLVRQEDESAGIALVDPRREVLQAAAGRLEPGEALYVEWSRPPLAGRRRLGRRFEAAGLELRWYWRWPRRKPDFWLPLDAPRALDFFLTPRRGPLARVWRWALRLGLLAPLGAVVTRRGGRPDPVEAAVHRHAGNGTVSWLLLTGGRRTVNKVVAFAFLDDAAEPALVVKFGRAAEDEHLVEHETQVLRQLEAVRPELAGIPRALFLERRSGRIGLGETVLEGEPLIRQLSRDTLDPLCNLVTDWLVELASGPGGRVETRVVGEPLERFARDYGSVVSRRDVDRARVALAPLAELPSVCEQRDCAPWNVLLARERIAVADWESAEPNGLPALDLAYFLTNAALLLDGVHESGPWTASYLTSLDPRSATGGTVASCEARYCGRLGIDMGLLPALRLLCWTIHARSEFLRLEQDAGGPPPAGLLERGLFLELWRAELGRQT